MGSNTPVCALCDNNYDIRGVHDGNDDISVSNLHCAMEIMITDKW